MSKPRMTRAHSQLIADALKEAGKQAAAEHEYKEYGVSIAVFHISQALKCTNPAFDCDRFVAATCATT